MRCANTVMGLGCGKEATPGSRLCEHCFSMVNGPILKDPVLSPLLVGVVVLVVLFIAAMYAATTHAADTTYTVKVVSVDHGNQRLEAKFIVMPQDLRLVCHGEAKKVFAGDYVKVEFKGGKTTIAGADCDQVLWLR